MQPTKGLTLIELLVSMVLVGVLVVVATGFLLPLRLTAEGSQETQSASLARSYLELVKGRWLDESSYSYKDAGQTYYGKLPKACLYGSTATDCDIKLPKDWTLTVNTTSQAFWTDVAVIKKIQIEVKSPNANVVKFETLVSKP